MVIEINIEGACQYAKFRKLSVCGRITIAACAIITGIVLAFLTIFLFTIVQQDPATRPPKLLSDQCFALFTVATLVAESSEPEKSGFIPYDFIRETKYRYDVQQVEKRFEEQLRLRQNYFTVDPFCFYIIFYIIFPFCWIVTSCCACILRRKTSDSGHLAIFVYYCLLSIYFLNALVTFDVDGCKQDIHGLF